MPECLGNRLGLIDSTAPNRACIDLDETDDIRVLGLDEICNPLKIRPIAE